MPLETTIVPRPPYSLALSARMRSDTTRRLRDGVLTVALEADDCAALARVHQRPDGTLAARIEGERPEAALAKLRFVLAVDDDTGRSIDPHRHRARPISAPVPIVPSLRQLSSTPRAVNV